MYDKHPLDQTSYPSPAAELREDAAYLRANIAALEAKDHDFATSILDSFDSPRGCSSKQAYWISALAKRAHERQQPQPEKVQIDLTRINDLIRTLQGKVQQPKLLVRDEGGQIFRLAPAGAGSRYYGQINVTSTGGYDDQDRYRDWYRTWYGRLDQQGVFHASPAAKPHFAAITRALEALAADPVGTAAAYGKATGVCCVCARHLTDPRSVAVGYGPTCADNLGWPWGDRGDVGSKTESEALAELGQAPMVALATWEELPSGTQVSANAHLDQSFDELLGAFEDAVQRVERDVGAGYGPDVEEEAKVAYALAKRNLQSWVATRLK